MLKLLICSILLFSNAYARFAYVEEENIINVGEPTLELAKSDFAKGLIIYFYESYNLPSRQCWPEIQKAANNLRQAQSAAQFGKIECHDEVRLCDSISILRLPTIMLFRGTKAYEYRGLRTAEAIQAWVEKVVDFRLQEVHDRNTLFKFHSIAILVTELSNTVNVAYTDLLDEIEVAQAGFILSPLMGTSKVKIVTQGEYTYPLKFIERPEKIIETVRNIIGTRKALANFGPAHLETLTGKGDAKMILFFRTAKFDVDHPLTKAFDQAAVELNGNGFEFAYVNVATDFVGVTVSNFFGVSYDDNPTLGIAFKEGSVMEKYKISQNENEETINVKQFIQEFKNGRYQRHYMSAPIPEKNIGFVREIVFDNFDTVTRNPDQNVFVMLYYPWCEPCVNLETIWKALASRFRKRKDLLFAKMDISQNDLIGYSFIDYPAFMFYSTGSNKEIVIYNDEKNLRSFKAFLIKHIPSLEEAIDL